MDEIFNHDPYTFFASNEKPFIIDAGANIGIATLYFKKNYPQSTIICFEPDNNAFQVLEKNIVQNNITDVQLVNAALSKEENTIKFFGDLSQHSPDTRGNSIIKEWGLQRNYSESTMVKSVKLSHYINSTVDFLKLHIEGAEQQVLEELENSKKLSLICSLVIEVHHSEVIKNINSIDAIVALLRRNQFYFTVLKKSIKEVLPPETKGWFKATEPHLFIIKATRSLMPVD